MINQMSLLRRVIATGRGSGLRAELIRGAMGIGGLKVLALPVGLAVSILLARTLGPEGYGQYAFIMSVVTIISLPINQGMRQLMTREVASYHHGAEWGLLRGLLRRSHQWVLFLSLIVAVVLGTVAVFNASWEVSDRWTLLLIGLIIPPFLGLNALRGGALRGFGNVVLSQLPELLVNPALHLTIALSLFAFGLLNPATTIMSQALAAVFALMLGTYFLYRKLPRQLHDTALEYQSGKWIRAWIPFTLLMAASQFNNQIGILLLGWLGTDEQIAALRVADRGAKLVIFSLGVVNLVIAPHITRAYRDANRHRLQQLSRQSARAALAIAIPLALPMIFFGGPIIDLVVGSEYVALSVAPLAILASAQLVNVAFGSVGMFLVMSGFERDTLFGQLVALACNALAAIILIPRFGAEGAAYAAAIGLLTWNFILAVKFVQRLKLRPSIF